MQQIKIFKSNEYEVEKLETEMNQWLANKKVKPVNIFGNISPQSGQEKSDPRRPGLSPSDVFLVLVYETL